MYYDYFIPSNTYFILIISFNIYLVILRFLIKINLIKSHKNIFNKLINKKITQLFIYYVL